MGLTCNLEDKKRNEAKISEQEFKQITDGLIAEANILREEKKNLEKNISDLKRTNEDLNNKLNTKEKMQKMKNMHGMNNMQNLNYNNNINIIGGNINNQNYHNNNIIKFVLMDGNEIFITKNYLKKTGEILNALRAQKPDLPDISHLKFIYQSEAITDYFKNNLEISSLNFNSSILIITQ